MKRTALILAALLVGIGGAEAHAATPTLDSVGQEDRHSTGTFSATGADDVTVYFATKPDRGTDGNFLEENRAGIISLADDEIASGRWFDSEQLDPGVYYVLLRASHYSCYEVPDCMTGDSAVLTLTVPKPKQRFTPSVSGFAGISTYLKLTVSPLGETLPYRVCWTKTGGGRKCLRSTIDGYSWNDSASDDLRVGARQTRAMPARARFVWYVAGERVASKRVRIPRG